MAEGSGGEAAAVSFLELTTAASATAQLIRAHLSPPGAAKTWLGPSATLADALAGSVMRCKSASEGAFTVVVPPRTPSSALVKRLRNGVSVKVAREGSAASARYEELSSLQLSVQSIIPGIITMDGGRGPLANTVRRLSTGEAVTVSVSPSPPPAPGAMFTLADASGHTICASTDFLKILEELAVQEVPWAEFTKADGWGLPPVTIPLVSAPIRWHKGTDALSIATDVFGLPSVSSSTEALQFLFGCCDTPGTLFSVHELSYGFADDAPAHVREAVADLLSALPSATSSTPDIVDSVHSRLRAMLKSTDAPEPFVAFGVAWRQSALEPPRRQSRAASPSPSTQRRMSDLSPPNATRVRRTLEEEVAAMTPNTMRQRLVEALAACQRSTDVHAAARASEQASPLRTAPPAPSSHRAAVQHSGQLGGLFSREQGIAISPALTSAPAGSHSTTRSRASAWAFTPLAAPAPAPEPSASHVPTIDTALQSISPTGGEAIATAVVIPEGCRHMPVTSVVSELIAHGMPDVVTQFAHAAGDTIPATSGSAFEAVSLLRHIEEVFADVSDADPSLRFLNRPVAHSWADAAAAAQALLGRYSSTFRAKRYRAEPATTATASASSDDKPPFGSYKQVPTATTSDRPGACDAQLIEDVASAVVIRREHVRTSIFSNPTASVGERDAALPGEIAHFHRAYGQAAIAYILSNGMVQSPLSGHGVPMALAAVRTHLLGRVTSLVNSTVGFARALDMHARCSGLALSFLTGIMVTEDCVALLGGSAPHADAEIRREGGATSTGTLGSTSGPNAQLSIREAFSLWGQGLHMVLHHIPGISTSGTDFAVAAQLKKIPRDLDDERLLSICRYMSKQIGYGLAAYRTIRGSPLPDVAAIIMEAGTQVFQQRALQQQQIENAETVAAPLLVRIQQLEAAQAKLRSTKQDPAGSSTGDRKTRWGAPANATKTVTRSSSKQASQAAGGSAAQETAPAASLPSAQEATQQFLMSLQNTSGTAAAQPHAHAGAVTSPPNDDRITSRLKALLELSALYRQHMGIDPKGDATQEPCAYAALFGECTNANCVRCTTDKSFPQHLVDAVKSRCLPRVFAPKAGHSSRKNSKGAVKAPPSK